MPRRLAVQVPQTISRLLKSGAIATPPASFQALLAHPPVQVPPRAPYPRSQDDLPEGHRRPALAAADLSVPGTRRRDPNNSKKKIRIRTPSLKPKPIVYLEDRVRRQFFLDHPWEGLRPRTIVEQEKTAAPEEVPAEVSELSWWSTNPQPEDVIAFSVHLHKHHQLSLAQAYHHALAQYHGLRAEHETASRYAVLEAQAYGASFAPAGSETLFAERLRGPMPLNAAPETYRGFLKETEELAKSAANAERSRQVSAAAASGSAAAAASSSNAKLTIRVKPTPRPGSWSGGSNYTKSSQTILQGNVEAFANARSEDSSAAESTASNVPASFAAITHNSNLSALFGDRTASAGTNSAPAEMHDAAKLVAGLEQRAMAAGNNHRGR
ncbi:unnamed protein product [Parajaminaea phylloscopi]